MVSRKPIVLVVLFSLIVSAYEAYASSSLDCIYKAKIVEIVKSEEMSKLSHPGVTFGGVCHADTYLAMIKEIELNDSVYLSNAMQDLPYCHGLIESLSKESKQNNRPIAIKLCIKKDADPPKVNDTIDIQYNWSMGRTDTWATVRWTYLSLHMDRESRKKLLAIECEEGDGAICIQLGQMAWQDQDEKGEIESYRKACKIDQGYCTYYNNALNRTGQKKTSGTQ